MYDRNARDQHEKQRGAKLKSCWQTIIEGLTATNLGTAARCSHHLDLPTLKKCYGSPDNAIIELLVFEAHAFGLEEVADVYLRPLMYSLNSANADNARSGDYAPLNLKLRRIDVDMGTMSNGVYTVQSFFGAVHAILYRCVPPNQTLREYVEILIHLTKLLGRALRLYLLERTEFRPKASLLVGLLSEADSRNSRAVIGFNAVGRKDVKSSIIEERKRNLAALEKVQSHNLPWPVGNCAESETFAHIRGILVSLISPSHRLIVATLTLDIMDGSSNGPCRQCGELVKIVREELPVTILSLAPVKGPRRVQDEREEGNTHS